MEQNSVDLAYELAVKSYDRSLSRILSLDSCLQIFMTYAATITLVFAIIVGNLKGDWAWYIVAFGCFFLVMVVGIRGRLFVGGMSDIDPAVLQDAYIDSSPDKFKRAIVRFSGEHFDKNTELAIRKRGVAKWVALLLLIETFLFVLFLFLLGFSIP